MANKRILKDYLDDIAFSIEKIEQFTSQLTQAQFIVDTKTNFAVIRAFEMIGEAVKHLPEETRTPYPQIPWRAIAGIRDKLIHEYFGVNLDVIWETIQVDLPPLKAVIADLRNPNKV